jgi:hypothetical protein
MKIRLIEKGAEEAYKHINTVYGALNDIRIFLTSSRRSEGIPEHIKEEMAGKIESLERETKKAYDWICAIKE